MVAGGSVGADAGRSSIILKITWLLVFFTSAIGQLYLNKAMWGAFRDWGKESGMNQAVSVNGALGANFLGQWLVSMVGGYIVYKYHDTMKTPAYQVSVPADSEDTNNLVTGSKMITDTSKHRALPFFSYDLRVMAGLIAPGVLNWGQLVLAQFALKDLNPILFTVIKMMNIPVNVLGSMFLIGKKTNLTLWVAVLCIMLGNSVAAIPTILQKRADSARAKETGVTDVGETLKELLAISLCVASAVLKGLLNPVLELNPHKRSAGVYMSLFMVLCSIVCGWALHFYSNGGSVTPFTTFNTFGQILYAIGGSGFAVLSLSPGGMTSVFIYSCFALACFSGLMVTVSNVNVVSLYDSTAMIFVAAFKVLLVAMIDIVRFYIGGSKTQKNFYKVTNTYALSSYVLILCGIVLHASSKSKKAPAKPTDAQKAKILASSQLSVESNPPAVAASGSV